MKRILMMGILAVAAAPLFAADAKEEVTNAAKKLGQQANYSWKTTVVVPESSPFKPGPVEAKTEKDGMSHAKMSFGDNKTELVLKGQKAAFLNQEGQWQAISDSQDAEGGARWMSMMARNFKTPAVQAAELTGYTKGLKKDGDVYAATLTEEGVKALVNFRRGGEPPAVTDPSGSAKFWIADGVLTKYEFTVKGKMSFNNQDFDIDRTTTVEIKDVGKTKIELPAAATKNL